MSRLQYYTKKTFKGPWLLDANALRELDEHLIKHWKLLEERRINLLEDEINEAESRKDIYSELEERIEQIQYNSKYANGIKQISIIYEDSSYPCESLKTALQSIELTGKNPLGLIISMISGDIKCLIALSETDGLKIDITPEKVKESQDLFVDIYNWADKYKEKIPQQIWQRIAETPWWRFVYIIFFLTFILIGYIILILQQYQSVLDAQQRAIDLIDRGITNANLIEAVTLLLEMQVKGRIDFKLPRWFFGLSLVVFFFVTILHIRPKIVLGIGKGVERIRWWRFWIRFVIFTIPASVLGFIGPYLVDLVKKIFGI